MKKNIIYISSFLIILLILIISSYYITSSKYKFNDNVTFNDLINLHYNDQALKICENCVYMANNWDGDVSSILLEYDGSDYKTKEVYDNSFNTGVDVKIGDYYKKVIASYGIKENYAYWNVEFKNEDIYYYDYPDDIVDSSEIVNAYLRFIYYLENDNWVLLDASKAKKIDSLDIDEYIMFTFEFSFNGKDENVKDKTVGSYNIYYKKDV